MTAALVCAGAGQAAVRCAPKTGADAAAVAAVVRLYDAARHDDAAIFKAATTPDFYAYDGGKRFDGDGLLTLIKDAHATGRVYEWTVQAPKVEIDCRTALVVYVNRGGFTEKDVSTPLVWLESAALRYGKGGWRVRFLHSTRVPAKP